MTNITQSLNPKKMCSFAILGISTLTAIATASPQSEKLGLNTINTKLIANDAETSNASSSKKPSLDEQRKLLFENTQLGKEPKARLAEKLDINLLQRDAKAGNARLVSALELFSTRTKAKKLCTLGMPFPSDFYKQIDRKLLEEDAKAGNQSSQAILKLAENRINAQKRTILYKPFPKDFFEHVDDKLLTADADAGNSEMQYIKGRLCDIALVPPDKASTKKYYAMSAKQNNPKGQVGLGHYYENAKGKERDYAKALKLYKLAAEKGYSPGQNNYGIMLLKGRGVERNFQEANMWLTKAVEAGNAAAQANLGLFIGYGSDGYKRNPKEGLKLLQKSMDQGFVSAARSYAYMVGKVHRGKKAQDMQREAFRRGAEAGDPYCMAWYGRMLNRIRKHEEGLKWIQKAADAGHSDGLSAMADMLRNGGAGLKRDIAEAVRLHKILAKRGDLTSMNNLGSIYMQGKGKVAKDAKQSVKYYEMFLNHGGHHSGVFINLGIFYRDGNGVEQDIEKAIQYFERALKAGHSMGYEILGDIYRKKEYGQHNTIKMMQHYEAGAAKGNARCYNMLGLLYQKGEQIGQSDEKAIKYFTLAAKKNYNWGLYNLGTMYEFGRCGVKKDLKKASELYTKAIKKGHKGAKGALERVKKK